MARTKTFACLIAALMAASCGGRHAAVTVGSKNFTEQLVLSEIAAQHLEHRLKQPVDRKLNLGGTLLAHQALLAGGIDLYPEYTGTALTNVLKLAASNSDAAAVRERVRQEYARRFGLAWLRPLGFSNSFAMVVKGSEARKHGLQTLSDAAHYAPGWELGAGYEFMKRSDGYPVLMETYRLPVKGAPKTMDLGLLYRALASGQVSMAAGNETDGQIAAADLQVLRDDRHVFPPYECAYVVRNATLERVAGLREALEELSGKLDAKTMRELNYEVESKHTPVAEVARGFLNRSGLAP